MLSGIDKGQVRQGQIGLSTLVEMDFKTSPKKWWTGLGELEFGRKVFIGVADFIQISQLELTYGESSGMVSFVIPQASPEMLALCDNQASEVNERSVTIFGQLIDQTHSKTSGNLIGSPFHLFSGRMKDMKTKSAFNQREITLDCYGTLSRKRKPPNGNWTSADQRQRYPGDSGCDEIAGLKDKTVVWFTG